MGNTTIVANLWCDLKMSEMSVLSLNVGAPIRVFWSGYNAVGWA